MVGTGLENGVHVDGVEAEPLDVIELALHAGKITVIELGEIVEAGRSAVARIAHLRVPRVVVNDRAGIGAVKSRAAGFGSGAAVVVGLVAVAEAVGQDVVNVGALQPRRSLEVRIVYGELKGWEWFAVSGGA